MAAISISSKCYLDTACSTINLSKYSSKYSYTLCAYVICVHNSFSVINYKSNISIKNGSFYLDYIYYSAYYLKTCHYSSS